MIPQWKRFVVWTPEPFANRQMMDQTDKNILNVDLVIFLFFIIMILCQNANEKFIHSEWDLCIESYMTYGCLLFGCQIVRIVIVRQLQDWQMFSHQKRCAHRKRRKSAMRANQSHGMLLLSLLRCLAHRFSHRGNFPSITKHHRYAFIIYNLAMMNWLNFVASVHTQMP